MELLQGVAGRAGRGARGAPCAPISGTSRPRRPLPGRPCPRLTSGGPGEDARGSRKGTRTESGEGHVARRTSREKRGLPAAPGPAVPTPPAPHLLSRPFSTNPPFTPSLSPHPVPQFPLPSRPPPAILHHGLSHPLLPKSRTPGPFPGSSPLSLKSLALPRGPAYPRRPPRPPPPGPCPLPRARGALWNRPGPSTPARERYHAGASEQLSRLRPPASKSLSDWPDLSREGGTRRGSHPLVAGAPGAPVHQPGPAPGRSAQARPRPPARRGRPRPATGPAPPPGGGPHLLRARTARPAPTPDCPERRLLVPPALRSAAARPRPAASQPPRLGWRVRHTRRSLPGPGPEPNYLFRIQVCLPTSQSVFLYHA